MNPEEIANYLKKGLLKNGASDVIVSVQKRKLQQIKYTSNKIDATKSWESTAIGVFVCYKKRIIVTNTRDLTKKSADEAMRSILSLARSSQPNETYQGIADGPFKYKKIQDSYDKKIVKLGEKSIGHVEDAINLSIAEGTERCSGVFEFGEGSIFLATSNNVEARDKATRAYFSIRAFNDKHASGHMVSVSRILKNLEIKKAVLKATSIANQAVKPQNIAHGKYDVLFDHLPFANLLASIGNASSIFSVEAGLSCLGGKLNKRVGSNIITLIDDGTLKNGLNSTMFDAEGVPTRRNIIIKGGILKAHLHNTSTAKRHKTKTTANAGLIAPEPFNIILKSGKLNKSEMINSVKRGVYLTNVWYTRFQNYNTGDFSTIPRDGMFLIKNGKITHPIKNIRLSDNLLNILNSTIALSKEAKQIQGWEIETPVTTPMALVKGLNITKSEK
ncbi:hypothetical protein A3K72_03620 [Candidatus Woesearchaeota archaeon RBG_13_36_6]|nr:MAG: hypothetical protein A3K72_03620 [Candidatus Woesearchaeota archaeon RBG_13_36_6]